jgi:outer membrane protein assembly factor BamB
MPAFDGEGNLYFGAHDGCFYSLDADGGLRWMFKTGDKIYASPLVDGEALFFASGDGHLLRFDLEGNLRWSYFMCDYFRRIENRLKRRLALVHTRLKAYDPDRRKPWTVKCWSSPNQGSGGTIYITAYGIGLHVVDAHDGRCLWQYDLGAPRYCLSGVALGPDNQVFVASQRRRLHCFTAEGAHRWTHDSGLDYDIWGNPSVDPELQTVYFPLTRRERRGALISLDLDGKVKWNVDIPGSLRGTAAVSRLDYIALASLNGCLYFIDRQSGAIQKEIRLTDAQRGLWTTPAIDPEGRILITTKDSRHSGSLCCLDPAGTLIWRIDTGKALSTPVVDKDGRIYVGSWDGALYCYQT